MDQASASQPSLGEPSTQVAQILRANTDDDDDDEKTFDEPISLRNLFPLNENPHLSKQERFLLAHSCKISDDVVSAGVESLDLGLSLLSEFVNHSLPLNQF